MDGWFLPNEEGRVLKPAPATPQVEHVSRLNFFFYLGLSNSVSKRTLLNVCGLAFDLASIWSPLTSRECEGERAPVSIALTFTMRPWEPH